MFSIHHNGYTIRAIDEGFSDFGLEIVGPNGDLLYFNPCYLSKSKWGFSEEGLWTEKQWKTALKENAEYFLDQHVDTKEDEYAEL